MGETIKNPRHMYYRTGLVGFTLNVYGEGVYRFRFEYKNVKPKFCEIVTTGSQKDMDYYLIFDELRTKKIDHVINGLQEE
jgi:hypothetical protein